MTLSPARDGIDELQTLFERKSSGGDVATRQGLAVRRREPEPVHGEEQHRGYLRLDGLEVENRLLKCNGSLEGSLHTRWAP